jgi:pre-mRNA-splicing factor ISY1
VPQTSGGKADDETALEVVPGKGGGYRYFGAAKKLPGVAELFVKDVPVRPKRTRAQITKGLDADYYGYRDDDDGVLVALEAQAELRLRAEALKRWQEAQAAAGVIATDNEADGLVDAGFRAHVPLPSEADIEKAILQRRKEELLAKYLSGGE